MFHFLKEPLMLFYILIINLFLKSLKEGIVEDSFWILIETDK